MSDVVQRLRKVEAVERELAHDCDMTPEGTANWEYAETCKEAAAEIDRLREALEKINVGEGWAALIARAALETKP
jgi:hypothetical protein